MPEKNAVGIWIPHWLRLAAAVACLAAGLAGLGPAPSSAIGLAAEPAAAAACPGARAQPGNVKAPRATSAVICLINRRRAGAGLPRLKLRKPLRAAAKRHSQRMVRTGCFGHSCGGTLLRRVKRTRYLPCGCAYGLGETIAWGMKPRGKPRRIFRSWMRSPGHRRVLMDRSLRHIGVGVVWGAPGGPGASSAGTYAAILGYKG